MADVFISYAKQPRDLTATLAQALQTAGYSVWWDTDLLPYQSFRQEIDAQLNACGAVVIIWTPLSVNSQWVLAEADHAWRQSKLINTHTSDLPPHAIPKPFNQIHAVPVADKNAVSAAVRSLLASQQIWSQEPSSTRRGRVSRRTALFSAGCLGALALAGAVYELGTPARDNSAQTLVGHSGAVYSVAFSPFGYITGSVEIIVWGMAAVPVPVRMFDQRSSLITGLAVSPDGRSVLSTGVLLRHWDILTGQERRAFRGHSEIVSSVALAPDGRYAISGSADKTLKQWDIGTGKEVTTLNGHTREVKAVTFLPDGAQALSATDVVATSPDGGIALSGVGELKLWDLQTGRELHSFSSPKATSSSWTQSARQLTLWDVKRAQVIRTFALAIGEVTSVAFAPDGHNALIGDTNGNLTLWDVGAGKVTRMLYGHRKWVNAVGISPDGRTALSGSDDDTVKVWDLTLA